MFSSADLSVMSYKLVLEKILLTNYILWVLTSPQLYKLKSLGVCFLYSVLMGGPSQQHRDDLIVITSSLGRVLRRGG